MEQPVATPPGAIHLVFEAADEEFVRNRIAPLFEGRRLSLVPWPFASDPSVEPGDLVVLDVGAASLAALWLEAARRGWRVGVLPHPELGHSRAALGVARRLEDAVEDLLGERREIRADLVTCNGRAVIRSVVIGDTSALQPPAAPGIGARLRASLGRLWGLGSLRLRPLRVTTRRDKALDTAALGIVVVGHGEGSPVARGLLDDARIDDGQLAALVLAPRSVVQMAVFLAGSVLRHAAGTRRMPRFTGLIRSAELRVQSEEALEYWIDGTSDSARDIDLVVEPGAVHLIPGRHLPEARGGAESKERFRIAELPVGETREELARNPLPWIPHASEADFADLYSSVRTNARSTPNYVVLTVLSTLLATLGMFADSAPVIIGAMVLAPLMAPIVSLAMAVVRQDVDLLGHGGRTLLLGVAIAVGCATLVTLVTPLQSITGEVAARLKPTLLDLGVAVVSGIAAAYAHARADVARSLAGVAIAVALVPPLAVVGIGVGWGSSAVFSGALLLFLTNLAGIVLAGSVTFLCLGFAPFHLARRGVLLALLLVGVVSIPLGFGFARMVDEHRVIGALDGWEVEGVTLREIRLRPGVPLHVSADVFSRKSLDEATLDRMKRAIEDRIGRPVELEVSIGWTR
jgi:uncharacterized hydrophobic protein (TIGR00271 family)